jgi:hypothetical protein
MDQPMQPFSPEKILALWEAGRLQHALDRALTLLAAASPHANRAALADLPIGERDARLFELRALVFGGQAEAFAECPRCAEHVEFPLELGALAAEQPFSSRPATINAIHQLQVGGAFIQFRLPTSRDLAEVVSAEDEETALHRLVQRCTSQEKLPQQVVQTVSRAMLEADPHAEITLRINCPACGEEWDLLFDIVEFFWREIAVYAHRVLREIDTLARAYGWTEREILNLSAQRRQTYLEMLAA